MHSKTINIKMIVRVMGFLLVIESLAMLLALPFSFYYCEKDLIPISLAAGITMVSALFLLFIGRNAEKNRIGKREAYIIVSLSWVVFSFFGTLPYVLSGAIPNFTNAFFETMSGFTTTGASVLSDIESVSKGVLFWRSMTHWIGGMGIIVLSIAILPLLGVGGIQLFTAEVPGITLDKLHPRIAGTAKRLWGVYVLFTFLETVLLMFGGMSFFNAITHSFSTMATGGFSTMNDSVASFSPYIQYVITVFMFMAGVNFTLHYFALNLNFRKVLKNQEFRYYTAIIILVSLLLSGIIINHGGAVEESFRNVLFQVVSIVTTTGFVSYNYLSWPSAVWFVIFILMFTGGNGGSTGGGMKSIRHLILLKAGAVELRKLLHPRAFITVKYNGKSVNNDIIFNVIAFFMFYILIFAFGSLVMSFTGLDFESAVGASIASLGNIGPGIGSVGPIENYAHITVFGKWFLSFLMLLGRLELLTVLVVLSPGFWRN
jgi:trk system potassium uptake protein TrkH